MPHDRLMPNFFVVGAPKCGTTALHHYLGTHPDIYLPRIKEPHFFATDLPNIRIVKDWGDYLDLFECEGAPPPVRGEASVWYLFSNDALPAVRERIPESKLIVMLRNPVEFVQSVHSQFVYNGIESCTDFMTAWRSQHSRDGVFKQYRRLGLFGEQVSRALRVFPSEQLQFILLEDLAADPRSTYLRVLEFLGVRDDGRQDFQQANANKIVRSRAIDNFARRTPAVLSRPVAWLKRLIGVEELGILDRLRRINARKVQRKQLSDKDRRELLDAFADDVEVLGRLIGRDLGSWIT